MTTKTTPVVAKPKKQSRQEKKVANKKLYKSIAPTALKSDDLIPKDTAKNQVGRPTAYTQKIVDEIMSRVAMGYSIRKTLAPDHLPSIETHYRWLREKPEYYEHYTRAKEDQVDALAEDLLDIADDNSQDFIEDDYQGGRTPGYQFNSEHVQRAKLRIETRRWLMSKMKPRKYGDKLDVTSDGKELPAPILLLPNQKPQIESRTPIEGKIVDKG